MRDKCQKVSPSSSVKFSENQNYRRGGKGKGKMAEGREQVECESGWKVEVANPENPDKYI